MTTNRKSKANQWHLQRNLTPLPDGQRRWDHAYQNLLHWSQPLPNQPPLLPLEQSAPSIKKQEVPDDTIR